MARIHVSYLVFMLNGPGNPDDMIKMALFNDSFMVINPPSPPYDSLWTFVCLLLRFCYH